MKKHDKMTKKQKNQKHEEAAEETELSAEQSSAEEQTDAPPKKLLPALNFIRPACFFTAALFYMEIIFKCVTIKSGFGSNLFLILAFTLSAAAIFPLISGFFGKKANRIIRIVLLFLMMIPFGVEYFIFREYNIFYDIKTITNGAGGAATGFLDEIARLVFSVNGISVLLLLAVPAVVYLIFGKRLDTAENLRVSEALTAVCTVMICFFLGSGLVRSGAAYRNAYDKEYSFPTAVSSFGLITGLRLDLAKGSGNQAITFETELPVPAVTTTVTTTAPKVTTMPNRGEETETTVTTTTTYGMNISDIDFAALSESDSNVNGTWSALSAYVASQPASQKNQYTGMFAGKNLVFITAEAFTREAIREDLTPTLYRLYQNGIQLTDYYQPASAGTTGGEFQNVFGLLPMKGGASFPVFTQGGNVGLTLATQLNAQGYWGKAYHNNDYTFYSRHVTHNRLGYSEGFMGYGNGMEQYVKYVWPQSDLEMFEGTIPEYIDEEHFNVYYMTVSGHSGYGYWGNAMSRKNWEAVEELDYSEPVKAYLAANIELDKALEALVKALEKKGIADDTVICLTADHFPYGLDDNAAFGHLTYLSELYGYDVMNFIQRDHNAAIIWSGSLEEEDPITVDSPTSSLDLLPTLSNLFGLEFDSRLMPGRDVFSEAEALYFDRDYNWKTDLGYYLTATQTFYPNDEEEELPEDYVERMKTIVRNKISYCQGVMDSNYIAHVYALEDDS